MNGQLILTPQKVKQKLKRIAHQILERNPEKKILLVGIETRGLELAHLLANDLQRYGSHEISVSSILINKENPLEKPVLRDFEHQALLECTVIIVDDVQNSGRTMMYAIRHFLNLPILSIQTCVLVNRGHNLFPVQCDYVGLALSTTLQEHVQVKVHGDEVEVFLS
jgi:pyrimidine operon attenuation protein/uracil phosphoribosyltransferase